MDKPVENDIKLMKRRWSNLARWFCLNKTGYMDWTKYCKTKDEGLIPAGELFIDNIVLKTIDAYDEDDDDDDFGEMSVKINKLLNEAGFNMNRGLTRRLQGRNGHQCWKISFCEESLQNVMNFINDKTYTNLGLTVNDVDITNDCFGVILHSRDMVNRDQGLHCSQTLIKVEGYPWARERRKIYTKMIHQFERYSTKAKDGNNIRRWLFNIRSRLSKSRDLTMETGLERVEITLKFDGNDDFVLTDVEIKKLCDLFTVIA
jgi:hypothetical protein